MRFSRALIPTVKEAPQDASNVSHTMLVRGGFIRRVGAGMYDFLPLGLRVLRKVERIVREELDKAGALEILMPALLPAEYFKETERWDRFGDNLFRLKDRKGSDLHLGPTHEEIVTDIARREIRSYRDMPRNLYQVQTKFRDEPRPRGGLLRCREFIMKDAYSFDATEAGAFASYEAMRAAYCRIYDRMGLTYRMVAADSGAMGGNTSAEFQVLADSGEDAIVACGSCNYAANVEVAKVRVTEEPDGGDTLLGSEDVPTPGKKTIDDVANFLKIPTAKMLKSLLYVAHFDATESAPAKSEVVMVVVRGDHDANEIAVARALGVAEVFLAQEADVKKATGTEPGFVGPCGFKGRILVDRAASLVKNGVSGANAKDTHTRHVTFGRDFEGAVHDLRLATKGDPCPNCDSGKLETYRGIEAGHIFVLGTHYSQKMGALFLDESGAKQPIVMGCYGIGISRLVAAAVEQHNDADGIRWPMSLAPYQVHICTIGKEEAVAAAAESLYAALSEKGIDVLWDDRDERPGVKFKDADLIGMPLRVTIGAKGLATGNIELKARTESDPKKAELVSVATAAEVLVERVRQALAN
ncbi:MAG: proline--tRNA ligase [Polyangiaceae bacterium]